MNCLQFWLSISPYAATHRRQVQGRARHLRLPAHEWCVSGIVSGAWVRACEQSRCACSRAVCATLTYTRNHSPPRVRRRQLCMPAVRTRTNRAQAFTTLHSPPVRRRRLYVPAAHASCGFPKEMGTSYYHLICTAPQLCVRAVCTRTNRHQLSCLDLTVLSPPSAPPSPRAEPRYQVGPGRCCSPLPATSSTRI